MELVWFRVRVEEECFWVNLREDNKVSESKMAVSESNMAEFKMAAIIKLSQNEWVKFFFPNSGNQSWNCEWVLEENLTWLTPRWQNSKWLPSSCSVRMNEFELDWISLSQGQNRVRVFFEWIWKKITRCLNPRGSVWIQHCRNQDGCYHQVDQHEWVKFSFVQNGWIHDGWVQDGCHHQVESEWMSLSQIELVWVRVLCKMAESKMAEFKVAAIIKLMRLN